MKKRISILVSTVVAFGLAACPFLAGETVQADQRANKVAGPAGEIKTESVISSVTVHPDRAIIVRKAELMIDSRVKSVVFEGLPATLIPNSLRVTGKGTAAVKILGLDLASMYLESPLLPEIKKIQAEIDAVELEISRIRGSFCVLDVQEKFLKSIESSSAAKASQEIALGKADPASWERVVEFLGTKLQALMNTKLEALTVLKEKEGKIDALTKKLASMKPQRPREGRKVTVFVESSQPGRSIIALSYTVVGASWRPLYTLRAFPGSNEIELASTALIQQHSGENWEGVRMFLSTSSPALEARPSELKSWYLNIYAPRRMESVPLEGVVGGVIGGVIGGVEGGVVGEVGRPDDVGFPTTAPAVPLQEAVLPSAGVLETGLHLNFEIMRPVDVPSDGTPHKVPIDTQRLEARYEYIAVPKLRETAYLRGTAKNTLAYPLLPGQADLFISQDFVGSTSLDGVAMEEEVKTFFGEDGQIKVEYELVKREKSGGGFLSKTEKLRLVSRIRVQNLRKEAVRIEIRDQLPISQNAKIEVKDVEISPAPSLKDEKGILTWTLSLAPQEKSEIMIDFTIEYPRDAPVIGI